MLNLSFIRGETFMQAIRRILLGLAAMAAATVPAAAQTAAPADTGPSLLFVWVWILVAGIIIMIVGTSSGVNSNRR
jgi:hypothetical protein